MSVAVRTWEPRHRDELTEDALLEEGLIELVDRPAGTLVGERAHLVPGYEIAVGGFPAEATVLRILGTSLGVFVDPALGPEEWAVRVSNGGVIE